MNLDLTVNWPEQPGVYKVVQLYIDGNPVIRFPGGAGESVHAFILRNYLDSQGIKYELDSKLSKEGDTPVAKGERYALVGAGKAKVNGKKALFFGMSMDYKVGINDSHLEQIAAVHKDWELAPVSEWEITQ